jgi:hypothetical protein
VYQPSRRAVLAKAYNCICDIFFSSRKALKPTHGLGRRSVKGSIDGTFVSSGRASIRRAAQQADMEGDGSYEPYEDPGIDGAWDGASDDLGGDGVPGWEELRCQQLGVLPDPLRCLALHPARELVYAGSASGIVHAYDVENAAVIASARPDPRSPHPRRAQQDTPGAGSAAVRRRAADRDPAVRDIVVVSGRGVGGEDVILTATPSGLNMLTRGCAPRGSVTADIVMDACALAENPVNDAHVAVGGGANMLTVVDWAQERIIRQATLRGGNRVTCADWVDCGAGSFALFSTASGRISLCDPSSMREVGAVAAFTGPVTNVATRGMIVAACGMSMRNGISYVEPLVKLYDVRYMHQPMTAVPVAAGPICIAFDGWASEAITGGDAMWALSPDGVLQCLEISGLQSGAGVIPVSTAIRLDAETDSFTCLSVSPEGLVLCGDTGGFLHQWSAADNARINADSDPIWDANRPPPSALLPLPSFSLHQLELSEIGATIPMSVYPVERGLLSDDSTIASLVMAAGCDDQSLSLRSAPSGSGGRGQGKQAGKRPRGCGGSNRYHSLGFDRAPFSRFPPRVSAPIIETASWHDFVAYAKAPPAFIRNSPAGHDLPSYVRHRGGRRGGGQHRDVSASPPARRSAVASSPASTSDLAGSSPALALGGSQISNASAPGDSKSESLAEDSASSESSSPADRSTYVEMDLVAWESVDGFDFLRYNQSGMFCGLENALPNVYVNAAVQSLFFTPPFRDAISQHNCERDVCITCELGFLFTMLSMDVGHAGVAVEAGNFTKAFNSMANAGALGLLDGSTALPLAARIESFTRYLLEQLHKDAGGSEDSGVSLLTGANAISFGRFMPSGVEWDRGSRPFQHTLNYERMPRDFATLVRQTLYREMEPTRAFCAATSAFETMTQTRRLTTLPNLLLLGANTKADEFGEWWFGKEHTKSKSCRQRPTTLSEDVAAAMRRPPRLAESLRLEIDVDTHELSVADTSPGPGEEVDGLAGCNPVKTAYDVASEDDGSKTSDVCADYELSFVIAWVSPSGRQDQEDNLNTHVRNADGHLVAYVRVPELYYKTSGKNADRASEWWCLNDFVIGSCAEGWREVASFSEEWKRPCVIGYVRRDVTMRMPADTARSAEEDRVDQDEKLRAVLGTGCCNSAVGIGKDENLPTAGTLVGLDCEFVMMEREDCEITGDGVRTVVTPARMALARVSVVRGDDGPMRGVALIDDYVAVKEDRIVDYLTRFSGIHPGDLDVNRSRHTVRPLKTVYKKLLSLVDAGVIFVGHGLKKDLRVLNFAVPPRQVVDTVMLFRGNGKVGGRRLLSLRYLMGALLGVGIQEGGASGHDSVEDAAAAVRVYGAWEELNGRGTVEATISALYAYGYSHGWKIDSADPFVIK